MNNTVRRHPRTMGEAFQDATYACSITRPPSARIGRLIERLCWIASAVALPALLWACLRVPG
jgi:hypothetical protein